MAFAPQPGVSPRVARHGRLLPPAPGTKVPLIYQPTSLMLRTVDPDLSGRFTAALAELADRIGFAIRTVGSRIELIEGARPGAVPDAAQVLSTLSADPVLAPAAGLNHLMSVAEQVGGNPLAVGHGQPGLDNYGLTGYSGRGPVQVGWLQPRPVPGRGRPRVVVLDTGIGEHPWFADQPVMDRFAMLSGAVVGPQVDAGAIRHPLADSEGLIPDPMLGSLGTHAGHGTFIAGILRQTCPEAEIVALAVMGADGIVPEHALTDAVAAVLAKQREEPGWADAMVLSLGYYAENADDLTYSTGLREQLVALGRAGVAVFCAAGNDASSVPSYPAAFAVDPAYHDPEVVPLLSVTALNQSGSLAAFANDGPWVAAAERGVNVVSTTPVAADGSATAGTVTAGARRGPHALNDPDSFRSGFAVWSGTSFAAPAAAGAFLRALSGISAPWTTAARRRLVLDRARPQYVAAMTSGERAS